VKVDYYGSLTPLKNIANISTPDPQSIVIQPFDPTSIEFIEKAIIASDLGMNPANDGSIIRLVVPTLTEERRNELTKVIHKIIEDGRIAVRNIRREANEKIKELEKSENLSEDKLKRALDNIQEITNENIKKLNLMQETKEKELHSQ
jgi:ribosome recycling factor